MFKSGVQFVPFKEHPVVDVSTNDATEFDVVAIDDSMPSGFLVKGSFQLKQYAECLLFKICALNNSKIKPFLQYQCTNVIDPLTWLNKTEKLIEINSELFDTRDKKSRTQKALTVIEVLRNDIEKERHKNKHIFDFETLKKNYDKYPVIEDRICYLMEQQTIYRQLGSKAQTANSDIPFDKQIDLELEFIENKERIKQKAAERAAILRGKPKRNKIPIRGNINILAGAFYKMLHEKKINGLPYIDATASDIASLIAEVFCDKDGIDISESTIRTYLSPNKVEKRAKGENELDF